MLLEVYKAKEGTSLWTDLDYWSEQLKLDIPALKLKVDHLIDVHPYVLDFLFRFILNEQVVSFHRPHPHKEAKPYQVRDARTFLKQVGVKP